jgi:hypothetical protein
VVVVGPGCSANFIAGGSRSALGGEASLGALQPPTGPADGTAEADGSSGRRNPDDADRPAGTALEELFGGGRLGIDGSAAEPRRGSTELAGAEPLFRFLMEESS